jgi:hypothetical protein
MYAQLDLEVSAKDPKKREDHLIFINFELKNFIVKNTQKKKNFDVQMLQFPGSHGMRSCGFLRLVSTR